MDFRLSRVISFDYRRVNSQGKFTCPWGKKKAIPYFQDHHVIQYHGDIGRVLWSISGFALGICLPDMFEYWLALIVQGRHVLGRRWWFDISFPGVYGFKWVYIHFNRAQPSCSKKLRAKRFDLWLQGYSQRGFSSINACRDCIRSRLTAKCSTSAGHSRSDYSKGVWNISSKPFIGDLTSILWL